VEIQPRLLVLAGYALGRNPLEGITPCWLCVVQDSLRSIAGVESIQSPFQCLENAVAFGLIPLSTQLEKAVGLPALSFSSIPIFLLI
jgi:hypothetical protein